ncbi:MAG: glycerol-3-phosphate 1-O-acyltransferase PlsY [bacterium]
MIMILLPWIIIVVGSYLIGSLPTGYLAGLYCGIDLRTRGSGNIGSTNALRVLGKPWGYTVFLVDFLKGLIPVLLAIHWSIQVNTIQPPSAPGALAALCVLLGHSFPVWLRFRGGKGIASSAGVIVGLFPTAFPFMIGIWMLIFSLTRFVSVASIAASIALPVAVIILYVLHKADWLSLLVSIVMCALALWRHRGNISRLTAGTEPRFEKK